MNRILENTFVPISIALAFTLIIFHSPAPNKVLVPVFTFEQGTAEDLTNIDVSKACLAFVTRVKVA